MTDYKIESEATGDWPLLVSHKFVNGDDTVIASYYKGYGIPDPLPCMFVKRAGRLFQLLPEKEISIPFIKDQMVEKYNQFLEDNHESFTTTESGCPEAV